MVGACSLFHVQSITNTKDREKGLQMQNIRTDHRINEIDSIKGVFILLMVCFHLVYIEQMYPYCKRVVYSFHMPAFLFISGYLMNVGKSRCAFFRTILSYAIPYFVLESGYIFMAAILPINEHIEFLSIRRFASTLFLHPIGPYWYLQSLVLFGLIHYCTSGFKRLSPVSRLMLCGFIVYIVSRRFTSCSLYMAMFFFAGALLRDNHIPFNMFFRATPFSIVAIFLLANNSLNLRYGTVEEIGIVYLSISATLFLMKLVPRILLRSIHFIGRNTLPVFMFSPLFTYCCKYLVPWLRFDHTGLLFILISLTVCVLGSLTIAWCIDATRLSHLLFKHSILYKER